MNKITLELNREDIQETFELLCEIHFDAEWNRPKGIEQLIKQLDKYVDSGEV